MENTVYLHVLTPKEGHELSDFYVYLPTGGGYHVQYRFVYMKHKAKPTLAYNEGPNDPANCDFYRIREAYVGRLTGESFTPDFRALQYGEIGLAFIEAGAGDYVGGFHGDELATRATLSADGREVALDAPSFTACREVLFFEDSVINRCNTPTERLCLHEQAYAMSGDTVRLSQYVEWVADAHTLTSAFTPMLTVQRLDPQPPHKRLTDTVEFFDREGGTLVASFDTTPYGTVAPTDRPSHVLGGTPATAVRVSGKESGFTAECGITPAEGSALDGKVRTSLWLRYGDGLDSKVYFDIARGTAPTAGTIWQGEIYYRLTMQGR